MRYIKSFLVLIVFTTAVNAQQAQRPTIPVAPINDRPLTSEEVRERKAVVEPPSVAQSYEQAFKPSIPTSIMPSDFLNKVAKTWEPTQSFSVHPKDSIMIPVGQGLMNTISTNLKMVSAKSNDETSAFEIDEGYLYITVNTLNPISLILYEEGVLDSQVSVTLVPIPAPPTLVELEFNLTDEMVLKSKTYREKMELQEKMLSQQPLDTANTPYQQMITNILLPVAQGDIPRGFGLTPSIPDEYRYPCSMTIYHRSEQRLVSGKFMVDVVHVINDSDKTYNIREEMCLSKYVTAVALFQKSYLLPGEESEIYILRDKLASEKESQRKRRPSLIGG